MIKVLETKNAISFTLTNLNTTPTEYIIDDSQNLIGSDELIKLKEYLASKDFVIYFNDSTSKHWACDFKINNVWIESLEIENDFSKIVLKAYN